MNEFGSNSSKRKAWNATIAFSLEVVILVSLWAAGIGPEVIAAMSVIAVVLFGYAVKAWIDYRKD